jgi:hypothetical protein
MGIQVIGGSSESSNGARVDTIKTSYPVDTTIGATPGQVVQLLMETGKIADFPKFTPTNSMNTPTLGSGATIYYSYYVMDTVTGRIAVHFTVSSNYCYAQMISYNFDGSVTVGSSYQVDGGSGYTLASVAQLTSTKYAVLMRDSGNYARLTIVNLTDPANNLSSYSKGTSTQIEGVGVGSPCLNVIDSSTLYYTYYTISDNIARARLITVSGDTFTPQTVYAVPATDKSASPDIIEVQPGKYFAFANYSSSSYGYAFTRTGNFLAFSPSQITVSGANSGRAFLTTHNGNIVVAHYNGIGQSYTTTKFVINWSDLSLTSTTTVHFTAESISPHAHVPRSGTWNAQFPYFPRQKFSQDNNYSGHAYEITPNQQYLVAMPYSCYADTGTSNTQYSTVAFLVTIDTSGNVTVSNVLHVAFRNSTTPGYNTVVMDVSNNVATVLSLFSSYPTVTKIEIIDNTTIRILGIEKVYKTVLFAYSNVAFLYRDKRLHGRIAGSGKLFAITAYNGHRFIIEDERLGITVGVLQNDGSVVTQGYSTSHSGLIPGVVYSYSPYNGKIYPKKGSYTGGYYGTDVTDTSGQYQEITLGRAINDTTIYIDSNLFKL